MAELKGKRLLFVKEFVKDWNATRAAKDAGYSKRSAYAEGCRLLKEPEVIAAIGEEVRPRLHKLGIDTDEFFQNLRYLAYSDITAVVQWDEKGRLTITPSKDLPESVRRAIAEVAQTRDGLKFKMHAKAPIMSIVATALGLARRSEEDGDQEGVPPEVHLYHPDNGRSTEEN